MTTNRQSRVLQIYNIISHAFELDREVRYDELVNSMSFTHGTSRRVCIEYLNVALTQIKHEIVMEKKVKWIIPSTKELSDVRGA